MFNQLTQNKMERDEMIKTILDFEKELRMEGNKMFDTFGLDDQGTKHAITRWCTIDDLIEKLKIEKP